MLSQSRYIADILADWERHQLSGGNFATSSYLYDFYYAVDTIGNFTDSRSARSMLEKMLPLISRRQRRDGLWYRGREWLPYTYSMVKTLIRFGFMQVEVDD